MNTSKQEFIDELHRFIWTRGVQLPDGYGHALAGRIMFTFNRDGESVSFVADDSDMHGSRSGPNVPSTPYALCVEMINDVVDHWDIDKLVESKTLKLAGMP